MSATAMLKMSPGPTFPNSVSPEEQLKRYQLTGETEALLPGRTTGFCFNKAQFHLLPMLGNGRRLLLFASAAVEAATKQTTATATTRRQRTVKSERILDIIFFVLFCVEKCEE